jgi:ADP-ribose pyrophosphatase YjhB (NUDIX family)
LSNEAQLIQLLDGCTPGRLSPCVFEAVARVAVYPAVEFIPLRKKDNKVEVLLFQRPSDDIIWPSMWHTPGTILRPTDETYEDAFTRLMEDELKGTKTSLPIFIGAELSKNHRGRCVLLEHLVIIEDEHKAGTFFSVDNLPKDFITDQLPSLKRAVAAFEQLSNN